MLSLNFNVDSHKYLEVIRGADTIIVLYSDNGSTIKKEVHTYTTVTAADAIGMLEQGMVVESVTNYTATGTWDQRYELEYTNDADASAEPQAVEETPSAEPETEDPIPTTEEPTE